MSVQRLRAVVAGTLAAPLLAGCLGLRPRSPDPATAPERVALHRQWSLAAQAAIDRRDWPAAEAGLRRILAEAPKSAEAHHRLGQVYAAQGRLDAAGDAERQALFLDPEYVDALVGLADVNARLGRTEAALGQLDKAIDLDPKRTEAHLALGRVLESRATPASADEALAAYFRALEFDPNNVEAMVRAAALQLGRGLNDQALARLDGAVELAPDDAEARHQRGRAHLASKHLSPALEDLRFAADRLPNRPDVLCDLALALEANRQRDDARRFAERALKLAPDWSVAREISRRLRR